MKTLLTMLVMFAATATTALAGPHGNSVIPHPQTGHPPVPPVFQDSFNQAGSDHRQASAPQQRKRQGRKEAFLIVDDSQSATTPEEGMFCGQDSLANSAVIYNYLTWLAGMNELQVQQLALENQRQSAENQLRLRKTQVELRAAENQKRMARIREQNAARPRAVQSVNVVLSPSGAVAWPTLFQGENHSAYRARVNQLLQQRARTERVSDDDHREITQMTDRILAQLKADIQNVPPQDYVAAKSFARGLLTELRNQPSSKDRLGAGGLVAEARPAGEGEAIRKVLGRNQD